MTAPVQAPTKFGLVINLETAKKLGLPVPTKVIECVRRRRAKLAPLCKECHLWDTD